MKRPDKTIVNDSYPTYLPHEADEYFKYQEEKIEKLQNALKLYADKTNWLNLYSVLSEFSYTSCSYFKPDDFSEFGKFNERYAGETARRVLMETQDETKRA